MAGRISEMVFLLFRGAGHDMGIGDMGYLVGCFMVGWDGMDMDIGEGLLSTCYCFF